MIRDSAAKFKPAVLHTLATTTTNRGSVDRIMFEKFVRGKINK